MAHNHWWERKGNELLRDILHSRLPGTIVNEVPGGYREPREAISSLLFTKCGEVTMKPCKKRKETNLQLACIFSYCTLFVKIISMQYLIIDNNRLWSHWGQTGCCSIYSIPGDAQWQHYLWRANDRRRSRMHHFLFACTVSLRRWRVGLIILLVISCRNIQKVRNINDSRIFCLN